MVIDVRSPAEFSEEHVPGAINLPVLNDEERARVGTLYKQSSPFQARKLGAALVFANAARHVAGPLAEHDGSWRPLVYCWRGGQRSGSFAWMLKEIGWRAQVLEGGYQSYRRMVNQFLYETPLPHRFVQLGGYTGVAKTALLARLADRNVQVLDLEALANHRGSLLGRRPGGQPSQKAFESALASQLVALAPDRPVIVEAESSKVGDINLPPMLWAAMKSAPWLEINAPLDKRAVYLAEAYADVLDNTSALKDMLSPLRYYRGHAVVEHWCALADAGDRVGFCRAIAAEHYDPAYRKAAQAQGHHVLHRFDVPDLTPMVLDSLAETIAKFVHTMSI